MLPLRNDDSQHVNFTVRLNLDNPRHREAWERLQHSPFSRTVTIVNALTTQPEQQPWFADADKVKGVFREAMTEVFADMPVMQLPMTSAALTMEPAPESSGEISDEDFDIFENFMNGL